MRHEIFHEKVNDDGKMEAIEKAVEYLNDQYENRHHIANILKNQPIVTTDNAVSLEIQ